MSLTFIYGFFAAAILSSLSVQARLGETEQEIQIRYGAPVVLDNGASPREKSGAYHAGGFFVAVTFLDGKSQWEIFTKLDKSALEDSEIELLLKANSFKAVWMIGGSPADLDKKWSLSNGAAEAIYRPLSTPPMFFMMTRQYHEFSEAQRLEKEKARLKGF